MRLMGLDRRRMGQMARCWCGNERMKKGDEQSRRKERKGRKSGRRIFTSQEIKKNEHRTRINSRNEQLRSRH